MRKRPRSRSLIQQTESGNKIESIAIGECRKVEYQSELRLCSGSSANEKGKKRVHCEYASHSRKKLSIEWRHDHLP